MISWNTLSKIFNYTSTSSFLIGVISLILIHNPSTGFFVYSIACMSLSALTIIVNIIRYIRYNYLKKIKDNEMIKEYQKITFNTHIINPVLISNFTSCLVGVIIILTLHNLSLAYMIMIGVSICSSIFSKLVDLYIMKSYKDRLSSMKDINSEEYIRVKNLLNSTYCYLNILCSPKTTLYMIIGIISLCLIPLISNIKAAYIYSILRFAAILSLLFVLSIVDLIKRIKLDGFRMSIKSILLIFKKEFIDNSFNLIGLTSSSICFVITIILGVSEHSNMESNVSAKISALAVSIVIGISELTSFLTIKLKSDDKLNINNGKEIVIYKPIINLNFYLIIVQITLNKIRNTLKNIIILYRNCTFYIRTELFFSFIKLFILFLKISNSLSKLQLFNRNYINNNTSTLIINKYNSNLSIRNISTNQNLINKNRPTLYNSLAYGTNYGCNLCINKCRRERSISSMIRKYISI